MPKARPLGREEHAVFHDRFAEKVAKDIRVIGKYARDSCNEVTKARKIAAQNVAENTNFRFGVMEKWDALVTKWADEWHKKMLAMDAEHTNNLFKSNLMTVGAAIVLLAGALGLLSAFGVLK